MIVFKSIFAANLVILALGQVQPQQVNINKANQAVNAAGNQQVPQQYAKVPVPARDNVGQPAGGNQQNYVQASDERAGKRGRKVNILQSKLASSEECGFDANRLCGDKVYLTDLEVLSCITDKVQNDNELREECHSYLWEYKLNVTKDQKFTRVTKEVCKKSLDKFTQCQSADDSDGKMIPCLLDHKQDIEYRPCYHFLIKMAKIIFSDYHFICDFIDSCKNDIQDFECGRISKVNVDDSQEAQMSHTQGEVVKCLEDAIVDGSDVTDACAKQIVRIAEFSSDDFHLDRNLYFACKDDREKLCENVVAGEGKVYQCLFQHKFDPEMSPDCRNALTRRQRLVARDYKASYALQTHCQKEIDDLKCSKNPAYMSNSANDQNDLIGLSGMLLCIEEAKLAGRYAPNPQCESHLGEFRKMLADDYKMSPEIVKSCGTEISAHCTGGLEKNGGTLHCLMALAQNDVKDGKRYELSLSDGCVKSIIHLLKEDHAVSDYRMDRALATACNPVVETACKSHEPGDPLILSCLMEHIYTKYMTDDCRKRLLEIQYFLTRDFSLDEKFYVKCKKDAKILCNEDPKNMEQNEVNMPFSLVISCLYRHIPNVPGEIRDGSHTSPGCAAEVKNAMKFRALDVNLNPELEEKCVHALGKYCSGVDISKGSELMCLQDHFENITNDAEQNPNDHEAVGCIKELEQLTEIEEAEMGDLDDALLRACEPDVDRFCAEEEDRDEEGEVMQCLYNNKHRLSRECEAGVTHLQLIELEDVKFNYNFMKACRGDITKLCQEDDRLPTKKNEIIECLSESYLTSVLNKQPPTVSDDCVAQLTVENLQRHDDTMKFNPEIQKACRSDYKKHCSTSKESGLECLRLHHHKISPKCRKLLFKLEQQEAIDPQLDVTLMRSCKSAIINYCGGDGGPIGHREAILDCLIESKSRLGAKCRDVVIERERERYADIDLNPELLSACGADMKKNCADELEMIKGKELEGEEAHGEVIACLKEVEVDDNPKSPLSDECAQHIRFVIKEEESMYQLDPMLTLDCVEAINEFCPPEATSDVVECLKMRYFQNKISNYPKCMVQIARLLKEGRSDIMADPMLHSACQLDIQHYCSDIAEGKGRIMSCILDVVERGGKPVRKQCSDALSQRQAMWAYAKKTNLDTFGELADVIWASRHRSSLLSVITIILVALLFFGVFCGRMTKRVSRQRKML